MSSRRRCDYLEEDATKGRNLSQGIAPYCVDVICSRVALRASVAGVDGIAQWADLEDCLDFPAGFGIIVPEGNPGHWMIPDNCKYLHETIVPVILTLLVRTRGLGSVLPHTLNATQLREGVAGLLQKSPIFLTKIFV